MRVAAHAFVRPTSPAVLLVTHDVDRAIALADRSAGAGRQGRIAADIVTRGATPAELRRTLLGLLGATQELAGTS